MCASFSSDIYEVLVYPLIQFDKNIRNYQQNMSMSNTSTVYF